MRKAPVNTGRLRGSIAVFIPPGFPFPTRARIGTKVFYAPYVEFGTGLYGPERRMITPVRGKFLVFTVGGRKVFARAVRGMRPRPFLRSALRTAIPTINGIWRNVARDLQRKF